MRERGGGVATLAAALAFLFLLPGSGPIAPEAERASAAGGEAQRGGSDNATRKLLARSTGRNSELRKTIPITRRARGGRVVMSLPLPRIKKRDRIRATAEVGTSTTCVTRGPRCIGRMYGFNPKIRARIVLARKKTSAGGKGTRKASPATGLRCSQARPNRNHHCPLAIENGGLTVRKPQRLPCAPRNCRLNLVLSAHHRRARGGEVLVVGGDRPDGGVAHDKGRLSAAVMRAGNHRLEVRNYASRLPRRKSLQADSSGGLQVVYSQKLGNLHRGDVLIARARQRSAIPGSVPYFISNQIIFSSKRYAARPTPFAKRSISARGQVTETNGFNCTDGPSAFSSPCRSRKVGIVRVAKDLNRPLFVNLISRTFPLTAQQSRGSQPPVRILRGGGIAIQRLRAKKPRERDPGDGGGGGSGGSGGSGDGGSGGSGGGGSAAAAASCLRSLRCRFPDAPPLASS